MTDTNLPATTGDASSTLESLAQEGDLGLEDFGTEDFVLPRISIEHKKTVFQDSLTGEEFEEFEAVMLGLVKGRILWNVEVNEGDKPLCKSYDFEHGHPYRREFPWKESGFEETDEPLPCASCNLKEWDSHPHNKTPWCSEQFTFPLLLLSDGVPQAPALLTVQRSGIKPARNYLTAFARSKTPTFTVLTKVKLEKHTKGSVDYAVPRFIKGEATNEENWPQFAQTFRQIRSFVTTPPTPESSDGGPTAPAAASTGGGGESASATTEPADVTTDTSAAASDDDLPF